MSLFFVILVLTIAANCVHKSEEAKILAVFPMPCLSHQIVFKPYIQKLVECGHEIVVMTTDPVFTVETPKNLTEIDVHEVSYKIWTEYITNITRKFKPNDSETFIENSIRVILNIFEKQTQVEQVQDLIIKKGNTFDLILVEASVRSILGFSHVIKAPVIAISTYGVPFFNYEVMGAQIHPILYPYPIEVNRPIRNLTVIQEMSQYYNFYSVVKQYDRGEKWENDAIRKAFGDDSPVLSELNDNVQRLLVNIHPVWEGIRPVPPSVVHMGGVFQNSQRHLPKDLKQYLDSSSHGIIYVSFGTNVDTLSLPADKIQNLVKVFSLLPYDVLWKWNQDELPGQTKNIKIAKWFPQAKLLMHPKIKLFITHGGLHSTDEAIRAGVPLIGIPFFVDQWFNTKKYEQHHIGLQLNLMDLEVHNLMDAIKRVIEDKRYRDNIDKLNILLNDRPTSSMTLAVWHTEHVLRCGSNHASYLRAPAANMDWTEYFEVKLVFIVLVVTFAALLVSILILVFMAKRIVKSLSICITFYVFLCSIRWELDKIEVIITNL